MTKRPRLSDMFALHPFSEQETAPAGTLAEAHQHAHWQKIKFDNTVRVWIAVPTFLACAVLWFQHLIGSLWPMAIVFMSYGALQFVLNWYFMGSRHGRTFDFVLVGMDLVSMSLAIYFTGAADSPLYFLYFIPLIVHAFHRDSTVVMFCGISGVSLYALTILSSLTHIDVASLTNLGTRLFFMLLTVGVACLAITVLKRKDEYHRREVARLESQTHLSEMLNQVVMLSDIEQVKNALGTLISEGLGQKIQLEVRLEGESQGDDAAKEPVDVPAHSGVCIPIGGSENELFGELCVRCYVSHAFQRDEMVFLRFVARSLGLAIQRVLRMEELRKSLEMNSCVMAATIASVRSLEDTLRAVAEGMMTVLRVEQVEVQLWSREFQAYRSAHRIGSMACQPRQTIFPLKTLHGENLGEIRVERSAGSTEFRAGNLEVAATFAARAALAIENALAHRRERSDQERAA